MVFKAELENLKKRLLGDRQKLESKIKDLDKVDFGSDTDHGDEESDEAEEIITNLGIKDTLKSRLRNINWALTKFVTGKYGQCENCRGEISLELLKINPESQLCKTCKTKLR